MGADALLEPLCYALFTGIAAGALFVLAVVVLALSALVARSSGPLLLVPRVALFLAVLFLVGAVADVVWVLLFLGRWYVERDPVVAFSPLFPFSLDTVCGSYFLDRGSWLSMEALWFFFALLCWLVSLRCVARLGQESAT